MLSNPPDAYRTWIMGVQRTLLKTGHSEAAWSVGKYDRDLRGVYLSGASPSEGASVVSRRWSGGYNANIANEGSGWLIALSSLAFGGVLLYFALKPKTPTPSATPTAPTLTLVSSPADLFMV